MHWDRPHVHDTGSVGEVYTEATANPGTGYYLETLGGVLLLLSGGALLCSAVRRPACGTRTPTAAQWAAVEPKRGERGRYQR